MQKQRHYLIKSGFNEVLKLFESDFSTILEKNLQNATLSEAGINEMQQLGGQFAAGGEMSQEQIMGAVANIQDPGLKDAVLSSVNEVTKIAAQNGYGGLFYSAALIALGILVVAFVLQPIRKKSLDL